MALVAFTNKKNMEPKRKLLLIVLSHFTFLYLILYWTSAKLNNFTYDRVNATIQHCDAGELLVTFSFDGENQTATVQVDPLDCEIVLDSTGPFRVLCIDNRIIEVAPEGFRFKIIAPIIEAADHMAFTFSLVAFIVVMVDPETRKLLCWCCDEREHGFAD